MEYVDSYADLEEVYHLLMRAGFPFVPEDWPTAYSALKNTRNYVVRDNGRIKLWVGYHTFTDKQCDLDICVAPESQKEWFTKKLFKEIVGKALSDYGLEVVSCKCQDETFYRSLLRLGFKEGYSEPCECVFTYNDFERKFLNG